LFSAISFLIFGMVVVWRGTGFSLNGETGGIQSGRSFAKTIFWGGIFYLLPVCPRAKRLGTNSSPLGLLFLFWGNWGRTGLFSD